MADAPSPRRLASRALILCAVVARSYLEEGGDAHTEQLRQQIVGWLDELDLTSEASPRERGVLARPVGRLGQREQVDASWLCEGLAVLAWALQRYELPDPGDQVDPRGVADALGFLSPEAATLLNLPTVRPAEELLLAGVRMEVVHARLSSFSERRQPADLVELARGAPMGELVLSGIPTAENDLRLAGAPLVRAPEEVWREALSAAKERVEATRWLNGEAPTYGLS